MIDVLKELEKREHVDLSSQIKQVESANNRISDSLRSTNQLIDALKMVVQVKQKQLTYCVRYQI